jgi:hypothetical protein
VVIHLVIHLLLSAGISLSAARVGLCMPPGLANLRPDASHEAQYDYSNMLSFGHSQSALKLEHRFWRHCGPEKPGAATAALLPAAAIWGIQATCQRQGLSMVANWGASSQLSSPGIFYDAEVSFLVSLPDG